MKFLCRHEEFASSFIYNGIARELIARGNEFTFWKIKEHCAFDIFNTVKPDVFLGQGYNLDRATIKCLNNNPEIKVLLKVGIDSKEFNAIHDPVKYPVLLTNDKEKEAVDAIEHKERITVFNYCHRNREDFVIGGWKDRGYKIYGLLPSADTRVFYPVPFQQNLCSDITFIGGYWVYKAINLDQYIIPLCNPIGKYHIKIFGTQNWSVPQFLGLASDETSRICLCSAKICPSIHEPHSNKYGFDVIPRVFNIIACKAFCLSDYVESLEKDIFTENELVMAHSPKEFFELIDYYLTRPEERVKIIEKAFIRVMQEYTYQHRITELLNVIAI